MPEFLKPTDDLDTHVLQSLSVVESSRPAHQDSHIPRQFPAQGSQFARKMRVIHRMESGQRDRRSPLPTHSFRNLRGREIRPQRKHVPSFPRRNHGGKDGPELVPMPRRSAHQHERTRFVRSKRLEQPVQKPSNDSRRHVLRSRTNLSGAPEQTNARKKGKQKVVDQLFRAEGHGCPVQNSLQSPGVHVLDRRDPLLEKDRRGMPGPPPSVAGRLAEDSRAGASRALAFLEFVTSSANPEATVSGPIDPGTLRKASGLLTHDELPKTLQGELRDLADVVTRIHGLAEEHQLPDVILGVEPLPPVGPPRVNRAIPTLPGAKERRVESGPADHDAHRELGNRRVSLHHA